MPPRSVSASPCPDDNAVVAYLEQRLGADEALGIEAHIDCCPECRQLLSELAQGALWHTPGPGTGAPLASAERAPSCGHYRLEERVARGGMGEIWRAMDRRSGQQVAIKRILLPQDARASELAQRKLRLVREAEALERLADDHIVRCFGAGFDADDQPYLVMEWLEGEDLALRQGRRPLTLDEVLAVANQALQGLLVCHQQGVVHRDIKPANIFLIAPAQPPRVKLVDFGLALVASEAARLTGTDALLGTLHYLSPEQARGARTVDHRSDLYSLGVVLYQLATGRLPFFAHHPASLLLKIVTETPPQPRQLRPELPPELEALILRAMHREASRRFQSASEMLAALHAAIAAGAPTIGTPPSCAISSPWLGGPAAASRPERRLVSLLCVKAGASDHSQIEHAIRESGGRVQALLGGQLVGFFGLEHSVGDEALRAIRAGLALRSASELGSLQLLAATVHLELGHGVQLLTDELDRVAALVAELPAGELCVDLQTQSLVEDRLISEGGGDYFVVRGLRPEGLQGRPVLGRKTPTIGREGELAALRAAKRCVVERREAAAQIVVGPAGIGKTRLLHELQAELSKEATLYLEAKPDSSQRGRPYALVSAAIHRAAEIEPTLAGKQAQRLLERWIARHLPDRYEEVACFIGEVIGICYPATAALEAARRDPKLLRERVADAFESFFAAAGSQGLVALCFEDMHWADEESLRLCERLLERLDPTPLFVLASARPELFKQRPEFWSEVEAKRLVLEPLSPRSVKRLIGEILGPVDPQVVLSISQRCEGNPFFVEELSAWMVSRNVATPNCAPADANAAPPLSWDVLPASVEATLQSRLDAISGENKELLKAASIVGDTFAEQSLALVGFFDTTAQLEALERGGFLVPKHRAPASGQQWAFRHALVRQVAYEMVPKLQRQALHLRLAQALEALGEREAALLAHHYQRGANGERAAHFFACAAQQALRDSDPSAAIELYRQARTPEAPADEQLESSGGLAKAHYLLGGFAEAAAILDAIPSEQWHQGKLLNQAELALLRGRILCATANYEAATAALNDATALLDANTVSPELSPVRLADSDAKQRLALRFEIDHTRFVVMWCEGDYGRAGGLAARLQETARAPDHRCSANLALAYYEVVAGDLSRATTLAEGAIEGARQIGHAHRELDAMLLLASSHELLGAYVAASDALESAFEKAARLHSAYHLAPIRTLQGRLCLLQSDPAAGLLHYRAACAESEAIGDRRSLAHAQVGLARALCRFGERPQALDQAAAHASSALALVHGRVAPVEAEVQLALAEIEQARGHSGLEHAAAALTLLQELGTQEQTEVEILLVVHEAHRRQGVHHKARALLERGYRELMMRQMRISEAGAAERFLQRVPHNARLCALWHAESEA